MHLRLNFASLNEFHIFAYYTLRTQGIQGTSTETLSRSSDTLRSIKGTSSASNRRNNGPVQSNSTIPQFSRTAQCQTEQTAIAEF